MNLPKLVSLRERPLLVLNDVDQIASEQLSVVLDDDGAIFEVAWASEGNAVNRSACKLSKDDFFALVERLNKHVALIKSLAG